MATYDSAQALALVKQRLNRTPQDTSLDAYLGFRVAAAAQGLEAAGIVLTNSVADLMLIVDTAVWQYQNRDKPAAMPEWLRLRRRERWLNQRAEEATGHDT